MCQNVSNDVVQKLATCPTRLVPTVSSVNPAQLGTQIPFHRRVSLTRSAANHANSA